MKIVFRVDGSLEIGSGHIVRCCNLALAFQKEGYEVLFLTQNLSGQFYQIIKNYNLNFEILNSEGNRILDWKNDALKSLHFVDQEDIVILDNYKLDVFWEELVFTQVKSLVVIDDLANRRHKCHLLLDSNYYLTQDRYMDLVNVDAVQLIGPKYSILSEDFKPYVRSSNRLNKYPEKILLFFGGNDSFNLNQKVIERIEKNYPEVFHFICVVGKSSVHNTELMKLKERIPQRFDLHIQTSKMSQLMEEADIYIGSGGTVTWERAVKSLPSLVFAVADNQVQVALDLEMQNIISYVGNYSRLSDQVWPNFDLEMTQLLERQDLRNQYALNSLKLVDGKGVERIIEAVKNLNTNF